MANKIIYGDVTFEGTAILDGSCFIGESITGDELAIDTLDVTVFSESMLQDALAPTDFDGFVTLDGKTVLVRRGDTFLPSSYQYGAPVALYHDEVLLGKFYLESVTRKSQTSFALSCTSAIGLLDKLTHYGGMYRGVTVAAMAAEIIGGSVAYSIAEEVQNVPVYGWLPVATCRENLHQLLFAVGASLQKDTAGALVITFLHDESPAEIAGDRVYLGGSIAYITPATEAQVTEHNFVELTADETVTLFDNTDGSGAVTQELVTFADPCHSLAADGLTIEESGVNYAVLSGTGTLTGQAYTHTTKQIRAVSDGTSGETNAVSVTDATLVSIANSQNVADRLLAYHSTAQTVSAGLVVGSERPGDAVSFVTPFGENAQGLIRQMDIALSGMLRADTVFVVDYTPVGVGNYYSTALVVAASGTYSLADLGIPTDKTQIRLVVMGGGSGGSSGTDGGDGVKNEIKTASGVSYAEGGEGGEGGTGGEAGNGGSFFVTTVTISAATSLTISTGTGGESDTAGGNTVCTIDGTTYRSTDGAANTLGFTETLSGTTYGMTGDAGIDGGDGGNGGGSYDDEDLAQDGTAGESVGTADAGIPGTAAGENDAEGWGGADGASGTGSSAAAYQTPGLNGGNAIITWDVNYPTHATHVATGKGADGVTPPKGLDAQTYGSGGNGGHGGSGAGGAAGFLAKDATYTYNDAGKGGAGCVILYF